MVYDFLMLTKDPNLVDVGGLVYSITVDGVDGLYYRDHHGIMTFLC